MADFALVELGKFSEPINTLIVKIADAAGILYEPIRIRRKAKAEADAALIKATSKFKLDDLQRRTLFRLQKEELIKQRNIENVIERSFSDLAENAEPKKMKDDWLLNFFDKVKYVSSEQMQMVWAKILAGEANSQGSFSKTTLRILGEMSQEDAENFQNLSRFSDEIDGNAGLFISDYENEFYRGYGITFEMLNQLERLGLVSIGAYFGYHRSQIPQCINISYVGRNLKLYFKKEKDNKLDSGKVILSQSGEELIKVCRPLYDEKIFQHLIHTLEHNADVERIVVEN